MNHVISQLESPIDTLIFDCDGTLSAIEGIDTLAEHNGVGTEVCAMTAEAMSRSGMNLQLYEARLALVNPTQDQIMILGQEYFTNRVEDAAEVIQLLTHLNKTIYIISAGLYPAVKHFGELLGISAKNIFAVRIDFDSQGRYINFDRQSPLVTTQGKCSIVSIIKQQHKDIIYVGDGLNDFETHDLATRFIGYGGVFYRENIAKQCQYYISQRSFAALLPLVLTMDEYQKLNADEKQLFDKGVVLSTACHLSSACHPERSEGSP